VAAVGILVIKLTQPPNPALAFSASELQIVRGQQSILRWYATNTNSLRLNGELVPNSGSRSVSPAGTITYRLVASGPGGKSDSKEVTVQVIEPAADPIIQFTGDHDHIIRGQSLTLRWSVTGATRVGLDPSLGPGSLAAEDKRTVTPEQTTEYTLTAEGPGGKAISHLKVWVDARIASTGSTAGTGPLPLPLPAKPTIDAFETALTDSFRQCDVVVLRWTVRAASAVSIQPEIGSVSPVGSKLLRLLQTTRYVLKAEGPGGSVSKPVTIYIAPGNRSSCGQ
jgi:hypothetical protein